MKNYSLLLLFMLILGCGTTPPKDNSDYRHIIGRTVKIHNLEIAEFDFPYKLDWISAKNACQNIGNGWRVPSNEEFDLLIRYKEKIRNHTQGYYWTSLEREDCCAEIREFNNDSYIRNKYEKHKMKKNWVRAVRNY
jgi:hypothetical protein